MKKVKSLRTKIIMIIMPLLLIGFSILAILSYRFASASFKHSNLETMKEMCNIASSKTSDKINSELNTLETIASNPVMWDSNTSKEEKIELLKPTAKILNLLNMSIGDVNGEFIDINGKVTNNKTSQIYLNPMVGKSSMSNPYIDPENNIFVVNYSVPITNENKEIVGMIAATKKCSDFESLLEEIKFLKSGSVIIVDSYGNFIVSKDKKNVGKNITNTKDKEYSTDLNNVGKAMINSKKTEVKQYTYKDVSKYIVYTPIKNSTLFLGITVDESEFFKELKNLKNMSIIITIIMVLIISIIFTTFFVIICKRLIIAKNYVDTMAEGDFKSKIYQKYTLGKDEINEICDSISDAKESIGGMICSVKNNAGAVKNEASELNKISSNLAEWISKIKLFIESVSDNANKQHFEFNEIKEKLNGFSDNFDIIQNNVNSIHKRVDIVNSKANDGNKNIEKLNNGIEDVNISFNTFCKSLDEVEDQMQMVDGITKIISDISEQTNLLALNASIEASRAGKEGKGFEVVAYEIRDLANESKKATQSINDTIKDLIRLTKRIIEESKLMKTHLDEQKFIIYEALSSFSQITVLVKEIAPKISNINNSFYSITSQKNKIIDFVEDLSEGVKVTSDSLEQVVAYADNVSLLSNDVDNNSDKLFNSAEELLRKVEKFTI